MSENVFGAVEGGGTKFVCLVGTRPDAVIDRARIPTTTPDETLERVVAYFAKSRPGVRLGAVGIACFGPLDLRPGSASFGRITLTPKEGWNGADVAGAIGRGLGVPVAIDTDVNGAALGEWHWGGGHEAGGPLVYLTVGTGVGGGAVIDGRSLRGGAVHPEMGHVIVPALDGDPFVGVCPYHTRCLEGIASGPVLRARTGIEPESIPFDHPAWDLTARYIAHGLHAITAVIAPARIVLGGGVGGRPDVLERVRSSLRTIDGGYTPALLGDDMRVSRYVVPPALGADSGVLGALWLARALASESGF